MKKASQFEHRLYLTCKISTFQRENNIYISHLIFNNLGLKLKLKQAHNLLLNAKKDSVLDSYFRP